MRFTIVGTILLCLMAFCLMANVSGSSLRERDLQSYLGDSLEMTSTKKKGMMKSKGKGKPTPAPDCSFTDTKKAAAFGGRILAQFWEDILKTGCSDEGILKVFNASFDESVVYILDGTTIASGLDEFSQVFLPLIKGLCLAPDTYLSHIIIEGKIDPVDKSVITIVTNRMISVTGVGLCGYGFIYTGKVSGKKCNTAKLTAITGERTLTLPGVFPCPP